MDDLCDRQDEDDCHVVSEALLWMDGEDPDGPVSMKITIAKSAMTIGGYACLVQLFSHSFRATGSYVDFDVPRPGEMQDVGIMNCKARTLNDGTVTESSMRRTV